MLERVFELYIIDKNKTAFTKKNMFIFYMNNALVLEIAWNINEGNND